MAMAQPQARLGAESNSTRTFNDSSCSTTSKCTKKTTMSGHKSKVISNIPHEDGAGLTYTIAEEKDAV